MNKISIVAFLGMMMVTTAFSEERLEMQGTAIIGNQELPKVLYIVPWKESTLPNIAEPPIESLINEALTPLDREVFQREVNYYKAMHVQQVPQIENQ